MVKESNDGRMALSMMVSGSRINRMVMERESLQMARCMKACGSITREMEKVFTHGPSMT